LTWRLFLMTWLIFSFLYLIFLDAWWLVLKSAFYQGFISSFCTWSINNSLTKTCFMITSLIL
jgi:hypothetical protein